MPTTNTSPFDTAFEELLNNFSHLHVLRKIITSSFERDKYMRDESRKNSANEFSSMHNMTYRDITSNQVIFFDHKELSRDDLDAYTKVMLNHQYQWIFINAFECFEKFIEKCHVNVASRSDTPIKGTNNLSKKLQYLRLHVPELSKNETINYRSINYRSTIALIEQLRHIMTHNGGKVKDIKKFRAGLDDKIQAHNNGNHDKDISSFIKIFLPEQQDGKEINLLRIYYSEMQYIDPLDDAMGCLLTYSSQLKDLSNIWLDRNDTQHSQSQSQSQSAH
mgnify:CR=1 FL=1